MIGSRPTDDLATIAVSIALIVLGGSVGNEAFDNFGRNVLYAATTAKVVRSARLPSTVALALDNLATQVRTWPVVAALIYV